MNKSPRLFLFAAFLMLGFASSALCQSNSFAGGTRSEETAQVALQNWITSDARAEIEQRTVFYSDLWKAEMKPEFFEKSYKTLPKRILKSVSKDKKLTERFERLVKTAAQASGWKAEIRAVLFEDEMIEVFNQDGLFIVASTEFLELSDDEALPIVLHEIAHNLYPEERGKLSFQSEYRFDVIALWNFMKLNKSASVAIAAWRKVAAHPLTKKSFEDYPSWASRIKLLEFAGEYFKNYGTQ